MSLKLPSSERKDVLRSLGRYFTEELDTDLGDMQAGLLLDYILKEIAPLAYNQGVEDARRFLSDKMEDLSASCFEHGLTYWDKKR
ncbi:DUF2164 domain-containing protein [Luteolibacter ambystomatis]|uniref:DUF2164 domain-containing protein n=1 Tax=Luteolibacter ambystomatis TaxID=2824561 RepID=A0A975G7E6_9BACT|nr:DUF2164 domain-containing protein [Luteolibacter ambystomatis]QUE50704.1 DUF2164 domain-containing protein [Luteolibacter ambystomatis]